MQLTAASRQIDVLLLPGLKELATTVGFLCEHIFVFIESNEFLFYLNSVAYSHTPS